MLLNVSNITKSFSDVPILRECSFHMENREKCALVGLNGAGKTTLLKIITGVLPSDDGTVTFQSGLNIGYLSQLDTITSSNTIIEEVTLAKQDLLDEEAEIASLSEKMKSLSGEELTSAMNRYSALQHDFEMHNGYAVRSEITGVLKGLGFDEDEFNKVCDTLSGGQKTRVALGKILLQKPDLIILDEPTNHLDISSIEWLENYLRNYRGAVLLVSHDRYFLDRIVTKVFSLENGNLRTFTGNYSEFSKKQKAIRDAEIKAWLKNEQEIHHHEEVIAKLKQFNREKSIKRAESREKMLNKMDRVDKPVNEYEMRLVITPSIESGNDVLNVENLSKAFPGNTLFNDISFEIKKKERVALIGNNGTGKTTLLKILNRMERPDSGYFRMGTNVKIGYYDQEHQVLHPDKTLFDEISDAFLGLNNTKIRTTLASFLFTGESVYKLVKDLSGGERGRLSLAKLMLSNANFLLLDEPTNHLDTASKEILEEALNTYEGTVFYVSHDRFFVNKTATRILDLTDGRLDNYIGNYDYYLEKRDVVREAVHKASPSGGSWQSRQGLTDEGTRDSAFPLWGKVAALRPDEGPLSNDGAPPLNSSLSWQQQKAEQSRIRKIENRIKKIEEEIEANEKRSAEINESLSDPEIATNAVLLNELSKEQTSLEAKNEKLMEEWEELQNGN
ncbi:MAG: ABC-F family ATP-binding cassette domain-containing protein [Lachnospiraceae bacterium]|nr:ABC-F family ATP-binding cassette domain-containing protein [Lachnospiraceae bacterium]